MYKFYEQNIFLEFSFLILKINNNTSICKPNLIFY